MRKMRTKLQALFIAAAVTVGAVFGNGSFCARAADSGEMVGVKIQVTYGQTEARNMLDLVNSFRQGNEAWAWDQDDVSKITYQNLGALSIDPVLERIAMLRAVEVALSFSHTRPNGQSCFTAYRDDMKGYIAENIAVGSSTMEEIFQQWLEADKNYEGQGHRRNMLGSFVSVGIGHVTYQGMDYWVQEFSSRTSGENLADANDSTCVEELEVLSENIQKIKLNQTAYTLMAGETRSLEDLRVSAAITDFWSYRSDVCLVENDYSLTVEDEQVASVENGILSAKSAGTTTMTVAALGQNAQISITVEEPTVTPTGKPDPAVSQRPGATEDPSASGQPEETGKPLASGQPEETGNPSASGQPEETGNPSASGQPEETGKPSASSQPEETGNPIASSQPDTSDNPSASSQPHGTAGSSTGNYPGATGTPVPSDSSAIPDVPGQGEESVQAGNPLKGKKVTGIRVKQKKKSGKVTIRFKRIRKADGYRITYARNKKFTRHRKVKYTRSASSVLSGMKHKKTYYFKVCAYTLDQNGKKQYGADSKIVKRKIK